MHYAKRIARAHKTLRNRLGVLQSLVDDWPLGEPVGEPEEDEGRSHSGPAGLTREDLQAAAGRWEDRAGRLKHTTALGTDREQKQAATEIDALTGRIERVERGVEVLEETGERSVARAILKMHREKFRIERYCQWHARSEGLNPISRHPQFYQPRERVPQNHV